jgi:hypothetical protein
MWCFCERAEMALESGSQAGEGALRKNFLAAACAQIRSRTIPPDALFGGSRNRFADAL